MVKKKERSFYIDDEIKLRSREIPTKIEPRFYIDDDIKLTWGTGFTKSSAWKSRKSREKVSEW